MNDSTLTLNSPITEDQWDLITDVDFDYTKNIWFHTKHGKDVEFVKRPTGHWLGNYAPYICSNPECGKTSDSKTPYCRYCGSNMAK